MAIHSFLKAEKGDPDWQFTPVEYYGKEFKILDVSIIDLDAGVTETVVLRQTPIEKELLAKRLQINVHEGSNLDLIILNDVDPTTQQVFLYDLLLKPNSSISLGIFANGGKFNKHIVQVFQEEGSNFAAYGLISNIVQGDTEVITKVVHHGAGSASNQLFLSFAGENSQTVFQGISIVEDEATNSEVSIENGNLITSSNGRCYSRPEVYANADNVRSDIWSRTDTINSEKLQYLQSRGIAEEHGREMIISSFREQVIDLVAQENIRDELKIMYAD